MLTLALCGCGSAGEVSSQPPDGVSVSVFQSRSDIPQRRMQIAVANESPQTLVVTGAALDSAEFDGAATWQKDTTTIRVGTTANLPVQLPEIDCAGDVGRAVVRLEFSTGERQYSVRVSPTDEFDRLPVLREEECFEQSVRDVAEVSAETLPRAVTVGGVPATELDITVTTAEFSTDAPTVHIVSATGTTLFAVADRATAQATPSVPLDLSIRSGDDPRTITLTLVPNRCDPHAIAEDKRGTILPIAVQLDPGTDSTGNEGRTRDTGGSAGTTNQGGADVVAGTIDVAASPAVKAALIDELRAACAIG